MAMLAGPRRKQKVINLRAKNNTWSNDTNKFGQRMLEKMGWSSGKGLGANENGIVEHVVARYKNDEKGLGFEDKNDQWTKHEDDFNALLANLSNGAEDKEKLHSGVSLEVKSKKSKARVHYHKFTRGKDLTRYSEKDLANIFGKKSFKELKVEDIDKPDQTEDVKTTEQIFTEKGSMEDYFKSKLAAFKSKSKILVNNNVNEDKNAEFAFKGFSNQSDEKEPNDSQQGLGFSFYNTNNNDGLENKPSSNELECNTENNEKKIKKKKKKSKSKDSEIAKEQQTQDVKYVIMENQDVADNNQVPNKKSKKKTSTLDVNAEKEPILDKCKKKRSKRKSIENCQETTEESTQNSQEVTYVPTKKKRRKNKCAKP